MHVLIPLRPSGDCDLEINGIKNSGTLEDVLNHVHAP